MNLYMKKQELMVQNSWLDKNEKIDQLIELFEIDGEKVSDHQKSEVSQNIPVGLNRRSKSIPNGHIISQNDKFQILKETIIKVLSKLNDQEDRLPLLENKNKKLEKENYSYLLQVENLKMEN